MGARARSLVPLALLAVACSPQPSTGPVEIAWDRDTCERCDMAIGDRRFAAQVRGPADRRAHRFDDLGCALLWIDEQGFDEAPAEIWVRSLDGERWLAAAEARFVSGEKSPMGYGFGAVADPVPRSVDLAEARETIRRLERGRRSPRR